jgi:hypothetical protein
MSDDDWCRWCGEAARIVTVEGRCRREKWLPVGEAEARKTGRCGAIKTYDCSIAST